MWNCMVLLYCHRLWNIIEDHNTNYHEYWENSGAQNMYNIVKVDQVVFNELPEVCNSEIFAAVLMKIKVLSVMTPCQLVIICRHFRGASCLHLQGILYYPEVTSVIMCVISDFCHDVGEMCALLHCYVACSCNSVIKELSLHAA